MEKIPSINLMRLKATIEESARIGALPEGGLCRLALSDADKEMRDLFKQWMLEAQLEVRVDDFGNMYGRREGRDKNAPVVLVGSHLDTQPEGGRFDGILGVLSALECVRTMNELGIETKRPIEIVNFTNEEGARFQPPLLGSGGVSGVFDKEFVMSQKDRDGKRFEDELQRIGYAGLASNRAKNIYSYIELHIEQGPVLEKNEKSIGAVEGIQGMTWLEIVLEGESAHAGPTPMTLRKDALLPAAKIITSIHELIQEMDQDARVTVGRLDVMPNVTNCVPGKVVFTVDVRHREDHVREDAKKRICELIKSISASHQIKVQINTIWEVSATKFSEKIVQTILESANRFGYPAMRMYSGAGHDAQYMSRIAPTAMIFVPSVNGKSHCQEELTLWEDVEKGANVLLHVLLSLAQE